MKFLAALQIIVLAATTHAATLEWKFAPGDLENYRLTQSAQLIDSQAKSVAEVKQELDLTWKVLQVLEGGSARISLTISAYSFFGKGPDAQEVRYDSQSTELPQGYAAMLAPIGKRLAESAVEFTMSPRGEVTDVKLPDELSDALKSIPSGKKFVLDGGLRSFEMMARLGGPLSFPTGEMGADQSWSQSREMELPVFGELKAEFRYKIPQPPSGETATIDQAMSVVAAGDEVSAHFTDEKSSGQIEFNIAEGRPETSTIFYEAALESPDVEGKMKLNYSIDIRRIVDETQ